MALGAALREALGDKRGIARYGFLLAMDEAEAQVALDLSGRPYFVWEGRFNRERVGELPTELVPHFFRSLAESLGAALHITRARRKLSSHDRVLLQGRGPQPASGHSARRPRIAEHQGDAVSERADDGVVIVANGGANIASLQFALQRLDAASCVSADPDEIRAASHVILPGVGAAARRHVAAAAERPGRRDPRSAAAGARHMSGDAAAVRGLGRRRCALPRHHSRAAPRALRRRPSARCRTWAGTLSTYAAPARCWPASPTATTPTSCTVTRSQVGAATIASTRLRHALQCLRAVAQFLRRAIPSRALRRGRRAPAAEFPGARLAATRDMQHSFPPSI